MDEQFLHGTVSYIFEPSSRKGFGFIKGDDSEVVFMQKRAMRSGRFPPCGTRVRYLKIPPPEPTPEKPNPKWQAVNVEVL